MSGAEMLAHFANTSGPAEMKDALKAVGAPVFAADVLATALRGAMLPPSHYSKYRICQWAEMQLCYRKTLFDQGVFRFLMTFSGAKEVETFRGTKEVEDQDDDDDDDD